MAICHKNVWWLVTNVTTSKTGRVDFGKMRKVGASYWKVPTLAYQELVSCGGRRSLALKKFFENTAKVKK